MLTLQVALTEMKRILRSRMLRVTLIVACLVPLLYGVLYLWAFWDPYRKLDKLPVAVINMDQGAMNKGVSRNIGNDLVKELKNNKVFHWQFVNSLKDAQDGLKNKKYYLAVEIPRDFTKNVLSVNGQNPTPAKLDIYNNEGKNLLATQIASRVFLELDQTLNSKINKEYLNNIFVETSNGTKKLADAATGSEKMLNGNKQLIDGSTSLSHGLGQINAGFNDLNSGLTSLHSGSDTLVAGLSQSSSGNAQLAAGLTEATGPEGTKYILNSINASSTDLNNLSNGVQGVKTGLGAVNGYLADAQAKLVAGDTAGAQYDLAVINNILNVSAGTGQPGLAAIQNSIVDGVVSGGNGGHNVIDNSNALKAGIQQLDSQLSTAAVAANQLASGSNQELAGAKQIYQGTADAQAGAKQLQAGVQQSQAGANQLNYGQKQIDSGLNQLYDGLKKAGSINTPSEKAIGVMSKPAILDNYRMFKVPNYGTGFAPYFIPLALWVGALILFFLVSLKENRLAISPLGNYPVVLGKFLTLGIIGTIQAVILSVVLQTFLGLEVAHPIEFYALNILLALCFIGIIQLFVSIGGNAGRFMAIVLLMLQLTSSAGTFPKETLPTFFQVINLYLPMTYGVAALREVISGGSGTSLAFNVVMLLAFTLVALALSMLSTKKWFSLKDLKPAEEI